MPVDSARKTFAVRATALVALTVTMLWGSSPAPAYLQIDNGAGPVSWQATSPSGIWIAGTNTLRWEFYTGNLPRAGLPKAAAAGGAVQNSGQSVADISGKSFNVVRLPDTTNLPASRDGRMTIGFNVGATDFYGNPVSANANAWTYVDDQNGVMQDADMFLNGNKTWTTDGSGGLDVQATSTHEFMHVAGAGHTPFFNARVFPFARSPIIFTQDHAYAPDDRNFYRQVYGNGANGSLSGTVIRSGGAAGPDRAVVVATDANDVPQAIMATKADGTFSNLSVPPGSYTLTVWNGWTSAYAPTGGNDVDFDPTTGATQIINSTSVAAVVTAGNNTLAPTITATDGSPRVYLSDQSLDPTNPQFQSIFVSNDPVEPSNSGTMVFKLVPFQGMTSLALADIDTATVSLGNGITVNAAGITTQAGGGGATEVHVPYTVTAGAKPGARNLIINYTSGGERLFIPGVIKVVGQGGLTLAASAGNPTPQPSALSAVDVPLLGFSLTANGADPEDVRVRRLAFTITGSGPDLPSVKLWIDGGATIGQVDGGDTRIFTSAAYSTAFVESIPGPSPGNVVFDNLAVSIPVGTTINFLLTADTPAAGTGTYAASLDPAGITGGDPNLEAHGMWWGAAITPTGPTISGGEVSTDPLTLSTLKQLRNPSNTVINPGESTSPDVNVFLSGVVTTTVAGTVGLDVEVQPVTTPATAFTGVPTASVVGQASGATINVPVTGLTNPQKYRWQARATHSAPQPPGPWVSFGTISTTEVDFSCDSSTTTAPTALTQADKAGNLIPVGPPPGIVKGRVYLSATNGTNAISQVRLEIEVQPSTKAFTGVPNVFSAFGVSGGPATATFSGRTGLYHWQARTSNTFGTASAWVNFNATTPHFNFKNTGGGGGGGGCSATVAGDGFGFWWAVMALGLLLLLGRQRTV